MLELQAEVALEAGARLGEGPVWDDRENALLWVDVLGRTLHRFDPASGTDRSVHLPSTLGSVALAENGDLVLALRDSFALLRAGEVTTEPFGNFRERAAHVRFNDGKVDPWGGFCAGTMDLAGGTRGTLYRLDAGGHVARLVVGVGCSNGLEWSEDRRRLYYIDTATHAIEVFDVDPHDGRLGAHRRFVQFPTEAMPDGLCLDGEGGVWVALWGSGEVRRYAAERLDRVVRIPVPFVTSMAFGGSNLDELYITTAAEGEQQDHAGDVFWCSPGVTGRRTRRFGYGGNST